ncbi:LysM peptidoglycan-binding domain-containing protein [Nesterenkonia populi]|uniref:LysM peptidoglycan-binding domain-containing protein n=1 Tax=Nesterenkonia populi TaxID=1591087 RepID=UPI0011BD8D6B|nr:LysM domain-containing protein [Nesterenkonia populi]
MQRRFTPNQPNSASARHQGVPSRTEDAAEVVVRPGDSLWSIAAAHLGSRAAAWEIAAEWPRWYRDNRDRIGPDPGMLLPGTLLRPPAPNR